MVCIGKPPWLECPLKKIELFLHPVQACDICRQWVVASQSSQKWCGGGCHSKTRTLVEESLGHFHSVCACMSQYLGYVSVSWLFPRPCSPPPEKETELNVAETDVPHSTNQTHCSAPAMCNCLVFHAPPHTPQPLFQAPPPHLGTQSPPELFARPGPALVKRTAVCIPPHPRSPQWQSNTCSFDLRTWKNWDRNSCSFAMQTVCRESSEEHRLSHKSSHMVVYHSTTAVHHRSCANTKSSIP